MKITNILRRIFAWIPTAHPENKVEYYTALGKTHKAYNEYAAETEKNEQEKHSKKL